MIKEIKKKVEKIKGKNISKSPKQVKLKKIISKQGYFKKRLSSKELENMSLREQLICLIERFKVVEGYLKEIRIRLEKTDKNDKRYGKMERKLKTC